jgi:hypothetical protein
MLFGFINRVSSANPLKETLDLSSQRTKAIAHRVAGASLMNQTGFALPPDAVNGAQPVNLEAEMTNLADEQLRYETAAKLLEKTYASLRMSIKER